MTAHRIRNLAIWLLIVVVVVVVYSWFFQWAGG